VDWSKIPNETRTTTDIGSEDDPGRAAAQKFAGRTAGSSAAAQPGQGSKEGGDVYSALKAEEKLE
jgi:hypothetical protein